MLWLYSGTPGSGKSYHAIKDIVHALQSGRSVITNLHVKYSDIRGRNLGSLYYLSNIDMTVPALLWFARTQLRPGMENQCLIVIDEAAIKFNCRDFSAKDRAEWNTFFSHHRHYGYNIILIAQFDRMLDRQIRGLIEYDVVHRKINNYGAFGLIFNILHIPMFAAIERWYGNKMVTNKSFFALNKRTARLYNTFAEIDSGVARKSRGPADNPGKSVG